MSATLGWMAQAACAGMDTDLFFPEKGTVGHLAAKSVCRTCPVRRQCLNDALADSRPGVWGGTTFDDRRRLRRAG